MSIPFAPKNEFALLNETQNATFDAEFHSHPVLDTKFL
jgi:hypothetical protein